ncbi:MAG TPA: c-type cytochrome [Acetobacteraceae bacterium]|nr:c-type cytochrome [Acetobacteraceae bacterium]
MSDHQAAVAALSDLQVAIGEIVHADQSYDTNKHFYYRASQRAINALEGARGPDYVASTGTPGDTAGAIGHIDALLDRKAMPVWAASLDSAEANMRAAVAHLADARHARELMGYEISVSRALAYLLVARGAPTELGVFGGMEGVLASTALGVPDGATVADGCAAPSVAPSYGVHGGYVAWVAVPAGEGAHALEENAGETSVIVRNGMIILPTAAASTVAKACNSHAAIEPTPTPAAPPQRMAANASPGAASLPATPSVPATASPADPAPANAVPANTASAQAAPASAGGPPPALYTKEQAEAGAQLFASKCVACHGSNLQGTAAPSVAGSDFLINAKKNGWTLQALRYLVTQDMPFNAPGSLSPSEYASALAFLLASNCYPSGNKPFPTTDEPVFADIKLGPVPGAHPGQNSFGVCPNG